MGAERVAVGNVLLDALVLPDVARGALGHDAFLEHIRQVVTLRFAFGRTVVFVVSAEGVVERTSSSSSSLQPSELRILN